MQKVNRLSRQRESSIYYCNQLKVSDLFELNMNISFDSSFHSFPVLNSIFAYFLRPSHMTIRKQIRRQLFGRSLVDQEQNWILNSKDKYGATAKLQVIARG